MPSKAEVLKHRRANDPEYAERVRGYAKAYRERNRDKERERQRAVKAKRRTECKEVNNAYMREWNAKNRDRLNAAVRDRLKNDPEYAEKTRLNDRERYAKNPEKHKGVRLKSSYGITLEQYYAMYEAQEHKCAICKKEYELGGKVGLAVDHCHSKGHVRGLLCVQCNHAIGKFEDNVEFLNNAIAYLSET